jgi:AAA domain-containing protein
MSNARTFVDTDAVREKTPLLIGLVGPSGSGKTFSALRLAQGFQKANGKEIFVIDTEARRALHYAGRFKFRHVAFGAPFGSLDYLAALEYCMGKGAGTIIVDSMSNEHEGVGGMLESHAKEVERLSKGDAGRAEKVKMLAWAKPKAARRRMIQSILQMNCNFIFCFRAREKLEIKRGQEPVPLGFMPIAGEEFIYEMTLNCLLLPGANGVPTWHSEEIGERAIVKLPEQFRSMFSGKPQLTEEVGMQLAAWAAGGSTTVASGSDELLARYAACSDAATLRTLEESRQVAWGKLSKDEKARVKAASEAAKERVERSEREFEDSEPDGSDIAEPSFDPESVQ